MSPIDCTHAPPIGHLRSKLLLVLRTNLSFVTLDISVVSPPRNGFGSDVLRRLGFLLGMFVGELLSKVRDDIGTVDDNFLLGRSRFFLPSPRSTGWLSSGGGLLLLLGSRTAFLRGGFLRDGGFLRRFGFLLRCSLLLVVVVVIALFVATRRWFHLLALLSVRGGGSSAAAAGCLLFGDALVFALIVVFVVVGIGFVRNVSEGATRRPRRFGNALSCRLLRRLLRWLLGGGGLFGLTGCFGSGYSCHGYSNDVGVEARNYC
mmetsp:Transcript_3884/g.8536  ORF Transcript_3884/g.8536 Transcript_3884/m.8536 type:complete len:261 (+) Transcript_3884:2087-2869(+)